MFFWLSCIMAGGSICLLLWVLTRPWAVHRTPAGAERHLILRWLWPWISAVALVARPLVSWRLRRVLERRLQMAGRPASLSPEQFVAIQVLAACALALMAGLGMSLLADELRVPSFMPLLACAALGAGLPWHGLGLRSRARRMQMLQEFPFLLDMTTLCVEAGLNLQGALQQAARHGPPGPLRDELRHALADIRAGAPRTEALRDLARRTDLLAVHQLVAALAQADKVGMSLGPLLRAQSEQRRTERFLRAEKLAQEAPVKMLFPMVFCIFPCTFLVLGFPIVIKLLEAAS